MPVRLAVRLRSLPPVVWDGLLALALMAAADGAAYQDPGLVPLHALTIACVMLPLTLRRSKPIWVTVVVGPALLVNLSLGFKDSFFETFALLVAVYTMVAYGTWGPCLLAVWTACWVGLHAAILIDWHNQGRVWLSDLPYNWLLLSLPSVLGYGVRTRRAYVAELEDRHRLLAREAAAEERNRIARELHDVVAHSVSVMVLQATAGDRVARRDPARAAQTFGVIQETGRQALADLRRAMGVLRAADAGEAELLPQPGLGQLRELVEQVRAAGIRADLEVMGEPQQLGPGVQLSAYRIVQESLTNILKHSGAASARVHLRYGQSDLVLEVHDDGTASPAPLPAGGHGLIGMRERVRLMGGELEVGPVAGGYRVWARLPIDSSAG